MSCTPARWVLAAGLAAWTCACGGNPPPTPPRQVLPVAFWDASWLKAVASDPSLPEPLAGALSARWLAAGGAGGDARWMALGIGGDSGDGPGAGTLSPALASRLRAEDARAFAAIRHLYQDAACALARMPDAYGTVFPEGIAAGAAWCDDAGRAAEAEALRSAHPEAGRFWTRAAKAEGPAPTWGDMAAGPIPAFDRTVVVAGEPLRYRLHLPWQLARMVDAAAARAPAPPIPGQAAESPRIATLVQAVGTAAFVPDGTAGETIAALRLPHLLGPPAARHPWARVEAAAEEGLGALNAALPSWPGEGGAPLGVAGAAVVAGWARRALYRDLGLALVDAGDPRAAAAALEESLGAAGGHPSRADPLLLTALGLARYRAGQPGRCAEVLRVLAGHQGWDFVVPLAETVARIAALQEGAPTGVQR